MTNRAKNKTKSKASGKKSAARKVEAKGDTSKGTTAKPRASKTTKKKPTAGKKPAVKADSKTADEVVVESQIDELQTASKPVEKSVDITAIAEPKAEAPPVQTTSVPFDPSQIVEQLEFLIALHDEQQNSFGEDDKLLGLWKQRFDLQNEQLDQIAQSIEGQKSDESLDELFELFHERFDVLEQRLVQVESTPTPESEGVESAAISKATSELKDLLVQNNKRFEALENKLGDLTNQIAKQTSESGTAGESQDDSVGQLFDLYNSHFSVQQSKLDELVLGLECKSSSDMDSEHLVETFNQRFEAIGSGLEKLASILQGQQQLLEGQTKRIDSLNLSVGETKNQTTDEPAEVETSETENQEDDSASHWNRQKEAMLSKYGIDPAHRPSMEMPAVEETIVSTMEVGVAKPEIAVSIENLNPEDAEAIEHLKDQLNEKLRDAEVELSIKRAKLSQFNAELDEKRVELERRESALLSKQQLNTPDKKASPGLLERLKRHLSAKERKNLDRM